MDYNYLLVDTSVLPKVFIKVIEAKQFLNSGKVKSATEAARITGISRSAFYKYKDKVFLYNRHGKGRIITIHTVLQDQPGVLSRLTGEFYNAGANILTVNQNIPIGGLAPVSIAARIDNMRISIDQLLSILRDVNGLESVEIISNE